MNSRKTKPISRIPALGRKFELGQLYDCRSEKILARKALWSSETILKSRTTRTDRSATHDVLVDDSFLKKFSTMGIDNDLKVSILGDMLQLSGSARYLNHRKRSQHQDIVTLRYRCTTQREQLDISKLVKEKVMCPEIFADGTATHVVCGIMYGGQAFFVFDKMSMVKSHVSSCSLIDAVKVLPKLSFDVSGHLDLPKGLEDNIDCIRCQLYSDFPTPYNPNKYKDAVKLFKSLSHFVEGRGAQALPVEIWLYPLKELDTLSAQVIRQVSINLVSRFENFISHLDQVVIECSDMINLPITKNLPGMRNDLQDFQQLVTAYKKYMQKHVGLIVNRIRCGSIEENILDTLLRAKEESPFAINQLDVWMKQKHVQLQILSQNNSMIDVGKTRNGFTSPSLSFQSTSASWSHNSTSSASSCPSISFENSSSTSHLTNDSYDESCQQKYHELDVCFHVSMGGKHSLTKLMKSYLQHLNSGFLRKFATRAIDVRQNNKAYENTLKRAEHFKDFVEANRYNDRLKFSFVEDTKENEKPDVYVSVLKDGVVLYADYQPPTEPGPAELVKSGDNKLMIKWSEPGDGSENISLYEVQYKDIDGSYSETIQVDGKGRKNFVTLTHLKLGLTYEVQVRANCEFGTTKWSSTSSFSTLPATPPGKPIAIHKIPNDVFLTWPKPQQIAQNTKNKGYIITVSDITTGERFEMQSELGNGEEMIIPKLKPESRYIFSVRAVFEEGETENGEESDILEPKPNTIMKGKLLSASKIIRKGNPAIHRLNIRETLLKRNEKIRKCELGKPVDGLVEKVIMVVGATGAGKTTLINGLVNYILGVDWKNKFRFQLIVDTEEAKGRSQAQSQTRWITSYTLHHQEGFKVPFTLTVIDTPGFGDTSGIKRDQEITQQIRNFFTTQGDEGIDHIDAIGFVTQASLPRLTPTQRFIFDQVLALFGKDISDNIFLLVTFADGQRPPVLEGAKMAEIPYKKFFKFNNSALYADNGQVKGRARNCDDDDSDDDDGGFDEMFWDMGERSFATFIKSLTNAEAKSLVLTKDVLNERHRLETHVSGIHQHIRTGLNKLEQLRTEVDVLKRHETDIEMNKDFTYTVNEEAVKTVNIPTGTYITNCLQCNFTCHYPCGIPDDAQKAGCAAMNTSEGVCMVCPARCVWNVHKNMTYRFIIETVTKTKTAEELKARYEAASGERLTAEDLVKKVIDDFENVQLKVLFYTDEVRKSLERLKDIALKPNPLSTVEYIDILIMSEESQRSPGWKDRRQQLEDVRKQAETLQLLAKPGYDPFEEYKKTYFDMRKKGEKEENIFQTVKKMFKTFL